MSLGCLKKAGMARGAIDVDRAVDPTSAPHAHQSAKGIGMPVAWILLVDTLAGGVGRRFSGNVHG